MPSQNPCGEISLGEGGTCRLGEDVLRRRAAIMELLDRLPQRMIFKLKELAYDEMNQIRRDLESYEPGESKDKMVGWAEAEEELYALLKEQEKRNVG